MRSILFYRALHVDCILRGPLVGYWEGGGAGVKKKMFVGKMGEINKWTQDMVEINILFTKEVK